MERAGAQPTRVVAWDDGAAGAGSAEMGARAVAVAEMMEWMVVVEEMGG